VNSDNDADGDYQDFDDDGAYDDYLPLHFWMGLR